MSLYGYSSFAGLGALFLFLGSASVAVPRQATNQTPFQPAAPAAPAPPSADVEKQCEDLNISAREMQKLAVEFDQKLQAKLAALQAELAGKSAALSAQFQDKQGEIELRAQELSARAQELADRMKDKMPQLLAQVPDMSVMMMDEGGGWLGVDIGEVTSDAAKELKLSSDRGVVVKEVEPDSPAAKAGLKANDVITQFDGQTVEGAVQFRRLVHETPPGRTVTLTITRDGASQNLSVEIGDRSALAEKHMHGNMMYMGQPHVFPMPNFEFHNMGPDEMVMTDSHTPILGISAEDLSGQLGAYFGAPEGKGILVREVHSGTPAEKAGLKAGDVIIKLDGKPIRTLAELREGLRNAAGDKPVSIGILRKGSEMSVPATIEKPEPPETMHLMHRAQL